MALTWPILDEGKWNLIASSVVTGKVDQLKSQFTYWVTEVATGAAAPLDAIKDKSPIIFEDTNQEDIKSTTAIDVYVWIEDANTDTSEVGIADAIQVTS